MINFPKMEEKPIFSPEALAYFASFNEYITFERML